MDSFGFPVSPAEIRFDRKRKTNVTGEQFSNNEFPSL